MKNKEGNSDENKNVIKMAFNFSESISHKSMATGIVGRVKIAST